MSFYYSIGRPMAAGRLLKPGVAIAAAVLAMALLSACGEGEPDATGSRSSDGTTLEDTVTGTGKQAVTGKPDLSEQIRPNVRIGPLRVTAGGPEQFRDIGDYTTLKHGKEATPQALAQVARVVHDFLIAHVRYDWAASCSYLDEQALNSLENVGSQFEEVAGKDCPTIIAHLLGKVPAKKTYVSSEVKAGVLRVRREGGYFFYRAGGDPYTINVSRGEDGGWKLASFLISQLSPPPSS